MLKRLGSRIQKSRKVKFIFRKKNHQYLAEKVSQKTLNRQKYFQIEPTFIEMYILKSLEVRLQIPDAEANTRGLRPATLLKKRLQHRCFPVNFANFLRTPFFAEHIQWLLLKYIVNMEYKLSIMYPK